MLSVWTKLTFTYSLDVWNFKTSVTPFFGHWAAGVALPVIVTHYAMRGGETGSVHGQQPAG